MELMLKWTCSGKTEIQYVNVGKQKVRDCKECEESALKEINVNS